jgi:hypothetical protein
MSGIIIIVIIFIRIAIKLKAFKLPLNNIEATALISIKHSQRQRILNKFPLNKVELPIEECLSIMLYERTNNRVITHETDKIPKIPKSAGIIKKREDDSVKAIARIKIKIKLPIKANPKTKINNSIKKVLQDLKSTKKSFHCIDDVLINFKTTFAQPMKIVVPIIEYINKFISGNNLIPTKIFNIDIKATTPTETRNAGIKNW